MPSERPWLRRLLVESVLIVFSILLALAAREWWQGRETSERVRRSLAAIETELERNREELRSSFEYHRMVSDSLRALAGRGVREIPAGFPPGGFIRSPDLSNTAWRTARADGTTAEMDHETLLVLSGAYGKQDEYVENRRDVLMNTYLTLLQHSLREEETGAVNPFRRRPGPIGGVLNDVSHWEEDLLSEYAVTLERLAERSAAEATAE